ncbi:MAG: hypothetical protein MZU79_06280 [Anaerotruncus sp.]|nr:hypothetical protein [Anaerotruncus sp.]
MMVPLGLTKLEKSALVAFIKALDSLNPEVADVKPIAPGDFHKSEEGAMKKLLTVTFGLVFSLLALSQAALAIPAFARKYGYNCNMCHVAFPKLNDWGQRFRDNGYQTPGQAGLEKTVFESGIPSRPADQRRVLDLPRRRGHDRRIPPLQPGSAGRGRPPQEHLLPVRLHAARRRTGRGFQRARRRRQSGPARGHRIGQRGLQQHRPRQAQPAHRPLRAGLPTC